MKLFNFVNYRLEIRPEAFTIQVFKLLVDRDKSKTKDVALKELAYIFHMCDFTSPYSSSLNDGERSDRIIKDVVKIKGWNPDDKVKEAIKIYKELDETITSKYLESMKIGLSKIDTYIRNLDEKETDGADMQRINTMISNSIDTVKAIRELEKLVLQDRETVETLKGGREKGEFIDER